MFPAVASNRSESVLKQKGEMANDEVTVSEPQFSQVCELLYSKIFVIHRRVVQHPIDAAWC